MKGDSGGPLTYNSHGQHVLIGTTSLGWAPDCAQEGNIVILIEVENPLVPNRNFLEMLKALIILPTFDNVTTGY